MKFESGWGWLGGDGLGVSRTCTESHICSPAPQNTNKPTNQPTPLHAQATTPYDLFVLLATQLLFNLDLQSAFLLAGTLPVPSNISGGGGNLQVEMPAALPAAGRRANRNRVRQAARTGARSVLSPILSEVSDEDGAQSSGTRSGGRGEALSDAEGGARQSPL
jgi:hypothetical protein